MNNLEIFKNEEFGEVKVLEIDNEAWFIGNQIARILGYVNPQKAIREHVSEEDKGVNEMDTPGGKQKVNIINESGLYSLILSSKLPTAKKFKRWVTSEVLPTIRKHGKYEIPKSPMEALSLMFNVVEDHGQKIDNMSKDIIDIKENAPLNPGEYNYIGGLVTSKVRKIIEELGLQYCSSRDVKKELFKSINSEIKKITGIDTRSQLKQKDFKMVKDFVQNWEPSKATLIVIQQLNIN